MDQRHPCEATWERFHGRFELIERTEVIDQLGEPMLVSTVKQGVCLRLRGGGSVMLVESRILGVVDSLACERLSYRGDRAKFREVCLVLHAKLVRLVMTGRTTEEPA